MKEDTKACNLTEREIKKLITHHGSMMGLEDFDEHIERLNYLNKRLKAFTDTPSVGSSEAPVVGETAPIVNQWPGS